MPFTNNELETILYTLEGYLQSTDDDKYGDELVRICDKIIKDINKNLRKYGSRSEKINETLGYILNRKK